MDDFEFSYIGESADQDDQDDLNEDFEPWSTCVNVEGKQIQGRHGMVKESKFQHS